MGLLTSQIPVYRTLFTADRSNVIVFLRFEFGKIMEWGSWVTIGRRFCRHMYFGRGYLIAVVVFWLATMGWLVKEKIAPTLLIGTPPRYSDIVDGYRRERVVGWNIQWKDRNIGWAVTRTEILGDDLTEVKNIIQFRELPIQEIFPLIWQVLASDSPVPRLRLRLETTLLFDPLKRLSSFQTRLKTPESKEPFVVVRGNIDKGKLQVSVQSGTFVYDTELPFQSNTLLTDSFSPQATLPNLRDGQKWTVEVYSPFQIPQQTVSSRPLEVIHAEVQGRDVIFWQQKPHLCWVVVYKNDPAESLNSQGGPRGRVWVDETGLVLKQEAKVGGGKIVLIRLDEKETARLLERVDAESSSSTQKGSS
jgi:hypothetical protein